MCERGLNAGLATEVAVSILGNGSGGEPSYTYDEDTRRILFQVYTLALNLEAKRDTNGDHDAPESSTEVQDD